MHGYGPHKIRTAKNLQGCILVGTPPPTFGLFFLGVHFLSEKSVGGTNKKVVGCGGALKSVGRFLVAPTLWGGGQCPPPELQFLSAPPPLEIP